MLHLDMIARQIPGTFDQIRNGAKILRQHKTTRKDHPTLSVAYTGDETEDEVYVVCMLFMAYGQQVYALEPTLERMLGKTDVSRVAKDMLRFPFDCFYIDLRDSDQVLWDGVSKSVPVRGIYVAPDLKGEGNVKLLFWGHEKGDPTDDATQWLTLNLKSARFADCGKIDIDRTFREIYLNSENETSIRGLARQPDENSSILGRRGPGGFDSMNYLLRLVVNALLYINSKQESVTVKRTKRRAPRRARRALSRASAPTVRVLGRKYQTKKYSGFGDGDGRRRIVPGHWREVWVGKKTDEFGNARLGSHRESRWILPYIVNAGSDTEITRSTIRVRGSSEMRT